MVESALKTFAQIYKTTFRLFYLMGLGDLIEPNLNRFYKYLLPISFVLLSSTVTMLPNTISIFYKEGDFLGSFRMYFMLNYTFSSLMKIFIAMYYKREIESMCLRIGQIHERAFRKKWYRPVVSAYTVRAVIIQKTIIVAILLTVLIFISSLAWRFSKNFRSDMTERLLPVNAYVPLLNDYKLKTPIFESLVFLTVITIGISYFAIAIDVIAIIVLKNNEMIYSLAVTKFKSIFRQIDYDSYQIMQKLPEVIKLHTQALKLSNDINVVFGFFMCANIIIFTAGASIGILLISSHFSEMVHLIGLTFVPMILLYFITRSGQNIQDLNNELGMAAYSSGWENQCDYKMRKNLIIIMMKSQVCPQIGYKFCPANMETYLKIIQTVWSWYTIVRSL